MSVTGFQRMRRNKASRWDKYSVAELRTMAGRFGVKNVTKKTKAQILKEMPK